MYAAENNEYKFGRAIPLPWYHHVYQVGDGSIRDIDD